MIRWRFRKQIMKIQKPAHIKGMLFISLFFSFFIMLLGMGRYSQKWLFVLSFFSVLAIGILFQIAVCSLSPHVKQLLSGEKLSEKIYGRYSDKKLELFLWLLITLFFIPTYIALFPGTFGYDAPVQAAQYFGEMELTAANPLLHTYLLGAFLSLGEAAFRNAALGLALFCLLQGLLTTHVLAKSFLFLKKIHTPFTVMIAGLLWILLNPTLHVLAFNVTKDILLGICLLHFLLNLLNVLADVKMYDNISLYDPAHQKAEKKAYLRLLLSGIIMCLMRNAAIYLVGSLILVMLLICLEHKKTILCLCMVFLISWLTSVFFTQGLKIPPGNARENMSIPIQQLAAVSRAYYYGTEPAYITQEQLNAIQEIIPVEALEVFLYDTVDFVKAAFDTETFSEQPGKYISLYLSVGKQNPSVYAHAFRDMVLPYFDMTQSKRRDLSLVETFPDISHLRITRYELFPAYYAFLEERVETESYFLIMQPGISIWLMVIGIGISFHRKNKNIALCILPIALYFIGLLLGPMALLRYLFPMMLATPLLFGILFWKE